MACIQLILTYTLWYRFNVFNSCFESLHTRTHDMEDKNENRGRVFISSNFDDLLKVYDKDHNDKALLFNGYQNNMNGKWYCSNEDGKMVYYFEKN